LFADIIRRWWAEDAEPTNEIRPEGELVLTMAYEEEEDDSQCFAARNKCAHPSASDE